MPTPPTCSPDRDAATKPLPCTSHLPFKQWDTIFPNASCAVALIDRLTHYAEIIAIEGESNRLRDAERSQKARRASA